jgi:hypothetical protein
VQGGNEYGAFDIKAKSTPLQHLGQYGIDPEPLPQLGEQQRASNAQSLDFARVDVGKDDAALSMPRDRGCEPVKFPAGDEGILAPERLDGALAHLFALAHAFDEVEVAMTAGDSFDDEHADVVIADTT